MWGWGSTRIGRRRESTLEEPVFVAWGWGPTRIEEDKCRSVAVVHVEVDDGNAFDAARLKHANSDGDIVERTESFAMVWERVVEPAADVTGDGWHGLPGVPCRDCV